MTEPLSYATPAARTPRLAAGVWIAIIGLALIGLGGCFMIGIMYMLWLMSGAAQVSVATTPGIIFFLIVMYAAALGCFGGAVILVLKGVRALFAHMT